MVERCRCHRPFTTNEHCWWPLRDPEPGPQVQVVVLVGDDPGFLRMERVPGGWHGRGAGAPHPELTGPEPWSAVGRCWDRRQHPVLDATGWLRDAARGTAATETERS
jgi:hypothetical protein